MGRAFKGLLRLLRRDQNLLFVVVAFGTTLGLAAVSGYWLFYRAAYVSGGLAPICYVWARANLRRLEVTGERACERLPVGPPPADAPLPAGARPAQREAQAALQPPRRLLRGPHPGLDRRPLRAVPLQPQLRRQPSAAGRPASGGAAALLGPACPP